MIRLLKFFGWSIVAVFCGLLLGLSGAFLYLSPGLPSVEALRSIQLQIPLRVYSSDEKLIAEFGEMRRTPIRFADIPPNFINALLSAEDDNFANHYGVDPSSLMRAATQLVKSGHIQSGGSTIPEIRAAFEREKQVQYGVESISSSDLDISKNDEGRVIVSFAYEREIELVDPVYLLLKFKGQSR